MALTRLNNQALASITSAALPAGSVIAADYVRKTDQQTFTSTTFADVTGLSVTMTPASTGSKFLVTASVYLGTRWWNAGGMYFAVMQILCNCRKWKSSLEYFFWARCRKFRN